MRLPIRVALIALLACSGSAALAQSWADARRVRDEGQASVTVEIDNDSLLLNKDDGFYTSGARFGERFDLHRDGLLEVVGWRIGQELYTPSDIKLPPTLVGPPDHPYAAWLFGGVYREQHRTDGTHWKAGLDLGCLGPCAGGEWTQTHLHRLISQPEPKGWSRQVRNEFGAVLYGELAPVRWQLANAVDLTPTLQARLGNIFTDAGASLQLRAGRLNALPDQSTLHGFMRIEARAVAYNASLQGGLFSSDSPHTVTPKRLVAEAEAGAVWISAPFSASVSVVRRGNEIRDLPDSVGAQSFVRLLFSYAL
ncbi:lipid A 3-O-deacylase [Actimicrobium sp. GrIS 1.19]|uniref:lipid A deacylase LpxR family protein n=1 Tax=Actimicrobium sp. GrIS 1.19 TaxID=3071708 RepID=UPI002E066381|nr:lipid A 3-O-deacylase [Actimicrobium sp. GrIS 1.19]